MLLCGFQRAQLAYVLLTYYGNEPDDGFIIGVSLSAPMDNGQERKLSDLIKKWRSFMGKNIRHRCRVHSPCGNERRTEK